MHLCSAGKLRLDYDTTWTQPADNPDPAVWRPPFLLSGKLLEWGPL